MMTKEAHLSCKGRLSQLSVTGIKQLCELCQDSSILNIPPQIKRDI